MSKRMKIVLQVIIVVVFAEDVISAIEVHGGYTDKITKDTPIPALNSKSPVIIKQTSVGTRQNLVRNNFPGNKAEAYSLQNGPVYRESFYMHKIEVRIPKERAIRVKFTKEAMLDPFARICLNSSRSYPLLHDLNQNVKYVVSSVRYGKWNGGKKEVFPGDNETLYIEKNALGESVEVSTKVGYNKALISRCIEAVWTVNGTVVRMYATNPDFNESVNQTNTIVYFTALGVFGLISICLGVYLFCIKTDEDSEE